MSIDTNKLRAAMPGYREAVACGDMQTRLEDVVVSLCDEIDRLRKKLLQKQVEKQNERFSWTRN